MSSELRIGVSSVRSCSTVGTPSWYNLASKWICQCQSKQIVFLTLLIIADVYAFDAEFEFMQYRWHSQLV